MLFLPFEVKNKLNSFRILNFSHDSRSEIQHEYADKIGIIFEVINIPNTEGKIMVINAYHAMYCNRQMDELINQKGENWKWFQLSERCIQTSALLKLRSKRFN